MSKCGGGEHWVRVLLLDEVWIIQHSVNLTGLGALMKYQVLPPPPPSPRTPPPPSDL